MNSKQKKKIGLILDDSRISGISIYTKNFAEYISKKSNLSCEIILPKKNSYQLKKQLSEKKINYKFYEVERISNNTKIDYLKFFLFKLKNLIIFYKKNNYGIYVIQGSLQFLNILALNYLKKNYIIVIHDAYTNFIFKFFLKYLVKKETKIIFVSKKSKIFYDDLFSRNKKIVIPTGSHKIKIKKKINVKRSFKIGTICNINPDKNIIFLLNVAKFFKKKKININFEIVGNIYNSQKNYYEFLKNKIKKNKLDNVVFLGFKKNVNLILKSWDLYCCFSKNESSPISVWEAMHHGLPIITTDVGDLKYHITKGKFGYLIQNYDIKKFASKIEYVLYNKFFYKKLCSASFNYSRKYFNLENNFKKSLEFLFSNKNDADNKKIKLSMGNLNRGNP